MVAMSSAFTNFVCATGLVALCLGYVVQNLLALLARRARRRVNDGMENPRPGGKWRCIDGNVKGCQAVVARVCLSVAILIVVVNW